MKQIFIAGILIFVGLVIFLLGLMVFLKTKKRIKSGITTLAIITNKKKKKIREYNDIATIYYSYEVTYTDYCGKTIKKVSDFGDLTDLPIGDKIEIIYDKEKTDNFIIFAKKQLFFYFYILGIGGLLVIAGIGALFF